MQTEIKSVAKTSRIAESKPVNLLKRIGSTTYVVSIRFSEKSTETFEDKVLRLIEREATKNA
jgi:ribosomal protein S10